MTTSHTDKFISLVLTKPLLVVTALGCCQSLKRYQMPLRCQTACSALGYRHLFIHSLPVFCFVPHKDELSILNSSLTVLQPSETPCIWNRTAGAAPPVFPSMKQELQKQNLEADIYSEGSCEHRHKPQGILNAK